MIELGKNRKRLLDRRVVLSSIGATATGLVGLYAALPRLLRQGAPSEVADLSAGARALVERAFAGIDASRVWDVHAHLVGVGAGGSGAWVNPDLRSHRRPLEKLRFEIYLAASGVTDVERADQQYIERLLDLQRRAHPKGKLVLLAFDFHVNPKGEELRDLSAFHTPNAYALALAREHANVRACASIHPYRRDAVQRLEEVAEAGAVAIKWLPNAMGIDPASSKCNAFYRRLAELDLPLLTHTGVEHAVAAAEHQAFGNPLRLRRPLDAGVRVIAAHCASLGDSEDLDGPGLGKRRPSFELFQRLMGESAYAENLYGGISAITLVNRDPDVLRELLQAEELHPRLVNGSDYPLPAIDPLVSTWLLARQGLLDPTDRPGLGEIFDANPLLFDFVLKRSLRVQGRDRTHRLLPAVFETASLFAG